MREGPIVLTPSEAVLGLGPIYIRVGCRIICARADIDAFLGASRVNQEHARSQS